MLAVAQLMYLPLPDFPLNFIPAVLFTRLPLAALAFAASGNFTALFRPFGLAAFATGIGFGLLSSSSINLSSRTRPVEAPRC